MSFLAGLVDFWNMVDATWPELSRRQQAVAEFSRPGDPRLIGAQDLVWALINSPAFLFNH